MVGEELYVNKKVEKLINDVIKTRYDCRKRKLKIKTNLNSYENFKESICKLPTNLKIDSFIEDESIIFNSTIDSPIIDGINNTFFSKIYNLQLKELKKSDGIKQTFVFGRDCNMINGEMIGVSSHTFIFKNYFYGDLRENFKVIDKLINEKIVDEREDFRKMKKNILDKYDLEKPTVFCDTGLTITQPYFISKYLGFKEPVYVLGDYFNRKVRSKNEKRFGIKYTDKHKNEIVELKVLDYYSGGFWDVDLNVLETSYHPIKPFEKINQIERYDPVKDLEEYICTSLYCLSSETIRKTKDLEKGIEKLNDRIHELEQDKIL